METITLIRGVSAWITARSWYESSKTAGLCVSYCELLDAQGWVQRFWQQDDPEFNILQ